MKCCRTNGLNKRSLYKEEVIRPSAPSSRHCPGQNGHRNRNIGVWGTLLPLPFRSFSLAFLANRSRRGLTLKSRRDERPQTGVLTPGNVATIEKAPRGRQRSKHVVIKHVTCSVALLGLIIVLRPYPGGFTPVCGLSRLRRLFSGQQ